MKVCKEVQHHYVNTAQGKTGRVVTISDSESQLHGPCNSNSTYCMWMSVIKNTPKSQETEKLLSDIAVLVMEWSGVGQKLGQVKQQQEVFLCLCPSWRSCVTGMNLNVLLS